MPPLSEDLWVPVLRPAISFSLKEPAATFLWPKHAFQLSDRQHPSLDDALKNTLEECGILRKGALERKDRVEPALEVAAMKSGKGVGKREIFITFDTFLARSRPGLGEKEGADSTNKKKKNKKNKKKKATAAEESEAKNWKEEKKENSSPKTSGWSNPAWAPKSMEGSKKAPALVQTKQPEKKIGCKTPPLAPTFSRFIHKMSNFLSVFPLHSLFLLSSCIHHFMKKT